jgi:hypothetical protein
MPGSGAQCLCVAKDSAVLIDPRLQGLSQLWAEVTLTLDNNPLFREGVRVSKRDEGPESVILNTLLF